MNLSKPQISESPINLIFQIVQNIEKPLSSLLKESNKINTFSLPEVGKDDSKEIIFSNTLEIRSLIDQVLQQIESTQKEEPIIFSIYQSNSAVQSMCKGSIDATKMSKQDVTWLMELEHEVYKNIDRKEIQLYDLSYNLAVSKRQLNRKVHSLLHLTPNKYIRILKLHRAKQLIDAFEYDTISQISYAVGYYDTHYFSKLFSNQYNISPKELLDAKR